MSPSSGGGFELPRHSSGDGWRLVLRRGHYSAAALTPRLTARGGSRASRAGTPAPLAPLGRGPRPIPRSPPPYGRAPPDVGASGRAVAGYARPFFFGYANVVSRGLCWLSPALRRGHRGWTFLAVALLLRRVATAKKVRWRKCPHNWPGALRSATSACAHATFASLHAPGQLCAHFLCASSTHDAHAACVGLRPPHPRFTTLLRAAFYIVAGGFSNCDVVGAVALLWSNNLKLSPRPQCKNGAR